ncbi:MAG TPA: hypothetical protein VGZ69_01330 [Candidatus Rhabdochlamydia sp.]|jgi:hypothetical protein|nr:hypothetical protein [Candidatus Rhabdochlamydia sp.]
MSTHSNITFHTTATTSIPPSSRGHQTPSSVNSRVGGVAFEVLVPQRRPDTEQLRFKLEQCGKTGSQHYTIVTWQGKRYRITVHDNKRPLAYSEEDWKKVEHKTISVLDRVQNGKHFFKGALQLRAKTKNRWKVTYENNTPHVECSVSKKMIRDFKNLFENQIKHTNILPAAKSPEKLKRASYATYKPKKKEINLPEPCKKILEKFKDFLRSLKSRTNDIEAEREKSPFEKARNHFFPSNNHINDFGDLSSTASISSFEEINEERVTEDIYSNRTSSLKGGSFEEINAPAESDLDDVFSDNTSLGGKSDTSSNVSNDSGSSYSPEIKR